MSQGSRRSQASHASHASYASQRSRGSRASSQGSLRLSEAMQQTGSALANSQSHGALPKFDPPIPKLRLGNEVHYGHIPGVGQPPLTTPQIQEYYPKRSLFVPEVGCLPINNVVGYGGYIPGKVCENVLASTYARANELAQVACENRDIMGIEAAQLPKQNPYGLGKRAGADIPGYCGYIPGKHAEGVFGRTYANANVTSTEVRRLQAAKNTHVPPALPDTGALGFTGYHPAYMALEKRNAAYRPPAEGDPATVTPDKSERLPFRG